MDLTIVGLCDYLTPNSVFLFSGHGKLMMKDGSYYEGEFTRGEITGHGFRYWAHSENTYTGQFYMGELQGQGIMTYKDGSVYEGEWWRNRREGIIHCHPCDNFSLAIFCNVQI